MKNVNTFDLPMTMQLLCKKMNMEAWEIGVKLGMHYKTAENALDGTANAQWSTRKRIFDLAIKQGIRKE